ncbi:MAG: bifunctional oligoribonuclease/PAP phosphatase NrnA [Muribaculaceae bacterium]|nr:bifunctional oligoribonuclease/PAP phosphatase NrnA [Muribaculaceae bacterium]
MIKNIINPESLEQFKKLVADVTRIVITCHKKPDGDAIGSSLGLCKALRNMGKNVTVIIPDQLAQSLEFMTEDIDYATFSFNEKRAGNIIRNTQLLFCLDYNALDRVDKIKPLLEESRAPKVLIDHHLNPTQDFNLMFSFPKLSSTCEVVFRILREANWLQYVDKQVASLLFVGMMTDTGNLSWSSSYPDVYEVMARLMEYGIDKPYLYKQAMDTVPLNSLKLHSYALLNKMTIIYDSIALIVLDKNDLETFNYKTGDTERLVNRPLSVKGVYWSTFMREDPDCIKVSMRSEGDFAVDTLCATYFGGGGHKNAAAGEFYGTIDEAVEIFHKIVEKVKIEKTIEK